MVVHIVQGLLQVLHGDLYVESSSLHGSLTAGVGAEFQVSHPLLLDVAIVLRSLLQALPFESSATYTVAKQIFKCCQRAFQASSDSLACRDPISEPSFHRLACPSFTDSLIFLAGCVGFGLNPADPFGDSYS